MLGLTTYTSIQTAKHCGCPLVALLVATFGCSVDDRELELARASTGGSAVAGSGGLGGGGGSGAEPSGISAPPPPICNYAPSAPVDAGCETLVTNPGFDKMLGTLGWPGATSLIQTRWEKWDATGIVSSGSMGVTNGLFAEEEGESINGALQCVPADAGGVYDVLADVLIPKQDDEGRAGISVLFYKSTDCNASKVGTDMSFTTETVDEVGVWQPVGGRFVVPPDTRSMEVILLAAKPFRAQLFTAVYDNVYIQKR